MLYLHSISKLNSDVQKNDLSLEWIPLMQESDNHKWHICFQPMSFLFWWRLLFSEVAEVKHTFSFEWCISLLHMPEYVTTRYYICFVLCSFNDLKDNKISMLSIRLKCLKHDLKSLPGNNIVVSKVCDAVVHWVLIVSNCYWSDKIRLCSCSANKCWFSC